MKLFAGLGQKPLTPKVAKNSRKVRKEILSTENGRKVRTEVLLAAFAMLAIPFVTAAAQEHADDGVAAKVLSLEQLWNQAEVAKDTQSLNQLLSDTFIFVDVDGSMKNKSEFLASVTDRSEHIDSIRSESMVSRRHGETVVISGVYHEKGTLNGKPYAHYGRFTDTWVKEGSAWMCAASQSTLTSVRLLRAVP